MGYHYHYQSISLGLSPAQKESHGKIRSCAVRFGLFWTQEDFTLSVIGVLSVLLWGHVADQLDLSHLRGSPFLFNDCPKQSPPGFQAAAASGDDSHPALLSGAGGQPQGSHSVQKSAEPLCQELAFMP